MKFRLTILILLLFAASARPQRTDLAFGDNEKLEFVVSYRARLIPNTEVADVVVTTSREGDIFTITGHGRCRPFFRWFFDLDDRYTTVMDATSLRPISASARIREGKYAFNSDLLFDWSAMVVHSTYRNLKRADNSYKTMPITNNSVDGVSLFYRLRNTDVSTLRVGAKMPLELVLEDTIRTLSYTLLGREEVSVPGLGRFRSLKFSCQIVTSQGESFPDGSEFFVWISDDRNRIPLLIESPIKVGSVRARLARFSGLRHPVESMVH